jgi:predicted nucleic acid-binding protein
VERPKTGGSRRWRTEAARLLECKTLLSEDLAPGRDYDGVKIENPFRR